MEAEGAGQRIVRLTGGAGTGLQSMRLSATAQRVGTRDHHRPRVAA